MKVAILTESPADQAAVHIFVNALLGEIAELHDFRASPSGCSNVFKLLPAVISELHFNATDVDGLVVTVDSDLTTPHRADHDHSGSADQTCRLCRLRQDIQRIRSQLPVVPRKPLRIAVGLAIPCIEAWFRCGHDNTITEAAWLIALRDRNFPTIAGDSKKSFTEPTDRSQTLSGIE